MFSIRFQSITWVVMLLMVSQACVKDDVDAGTSEITSFKFLKETNPSLVYDIPTEIYGDTVYAYTFAGTDLSTLVPDFEFDGLEVLVAGVVQESGRNRQDFTGLVNYQVRTASGSTRAYTVKFADTGLPAIYITTGGQEILNREDYVQGNIRIVRGFGDGALHEGVLDIRGRGNSTWGMPKKPYRIRLAQAASLLEMPPNRHWALIANYGDRSLLRNDVAFEISRRLALEYTPRQQYADVFLNGEYQGNYNLTEHIRQGADRVNINEGNGGYILEADGYAHLEQEYFVTPKNMPITIKFPDEDDISANQRTFITAYYTAFEEALFADDFADPINGYRQYFDLETFVNYYLANEICGNPDLFWSMRMYKKSEQNPLIYTGPVWDFDLGFNNDSRLNDAVRRLMLTDAHDPKQWINRIAQDPYFRQRVRERWNTIRGDVSTINDYIDQQAARLQRSQGFNFQRWNILSTPNIHLNWYVGNTYKDYVDFLKNYFNIRIAWLDEVFNGEQFDG